VAFSDGAYLNSYYTAALAPAVAALCGIGLSVAFRTSVARWSDDAGPAVDSDADTGEGAGPEWTGRVLVGVAVTGSVAYAVFLVPTGTGVRSWLVPAAIAGGLVADALLLVSLLRPSGARLRSLALVVGALALLFVPSVASATVVTQGMGPFDTPFESPSVLVITRTDALRAQARAQVTVKALERFAHLERTPILFVTDTSAVAANYILASGDEVLPIGGFTGAIAEPTLGRIRSDIDRGLVRLAIVPVDPPGHDPRIVWIRTHCGVVKIDPPARVRFGVYDCHNTV
jgi:hypothetical protein